MITSLLRLTSLKASFIVNRSNSLFNVARATKPLFPVRNYCNSALRVNTNVIKDVILYKYENAKFFKVLNIFALCQFGFWVYLSHFAYNHLKDAPIAQKDKSTLPWWRRFNLGENKYRNTIAISAFAIGYGILVISWMYTLKSVRFLILRKGGNDVTFVTYTPFGTNRMMTVNLKNVSCKETRSATPGQLPIKVKNYSLHYILDMRGEFKNAALFDHTAGLKRSFRD